MTTTTQDTRATIARLQARLGEADCAPYGTDPRENGTAILWGTEIEMVNQCCGMGGDECCGNPVADCEYSKVMLADGAADVLALSAEALNELPGQIARWLARLDEADRVDAEWGASIERHGCNRCWSDDYGRPCTCESERAALRSQGAPGKLLRATVTEDVQAWAVRLGVGVGDA